MFNELMEPINEPILYPCGCKFYRDKTGIYYHIVIDQCKFDCDKIGNKLIPGYNYIAEQV